jgi:hemerythrin
MAGNADLPGTVAPATGSETADAEHAVQLGLLEAAIAAVNASSRETAPELMDQLHEYTQAHFMSEQVLMRQSARPNYDGHLEDHERLMEELDGARRLLQAGDYPGTLAALRSHHSRLLDHIRSWDRTIEAAPV